MRPVLLCMLLVCGSAIPASAQQLKEITNSIGMKLVLIHAGSFTMGSPESEIGRQEDETPHEVTISNSYYLGAFEVTQGQYEKVMGNYPSQFWGSELPVEKVSWEDAASFCKKLSELPKERSSGQHYRLPTEAEWEYACRAGSTTTYCFGDSAESLGEYDWFGTGLKARPHPVGLKKPNRWGLYDMHGNVSEWCQDWIAPYPTSEATDPQGPIQGSNRVFRGGCFSLVADRRRSAFRFSYPPSTKENFLGFRVAMSLPEKESSAASTK